MKILQYLYYKIFLMHSKGEDNPTAAGLAVMTTSVVLSCNIFTILGFMRKVDLIPWFFNKNEGVLLGLSLCVLDYFLFMHKQKYLRIKERFSNESKKKRIIGGTLVLLYCFLSFFLVLALAFYKPGKI